MRSMPARMGLLGPMFADQPDRLGLHIRRTFPAVWLRPGRTLGSVLLGGPAAVEDRQSMCPSRSGPVDTCPPTWAEGSSRPGRLFTLGRCYAIFTDSSCVMIWAEEHHRDHAPYGSIGSHAAGASLGGPETYESRMRTAKSQPFAGIPTAGRVAHLRGRRATDG